MATCAICLSAVRETRSNTPIRCGHLFHSHCIDHWKQQGKNTCPVCRKIFDGSKYKVQVIVHNMSSQTSNTLNVYNNEITLEALDVIFEVQNIVDLDSLLTDFGVSMSDFDALILDAE